MITIDVIAQESFMSKTSKGAYNLLETMTSNVIHARSQMPKKVVGVHELDEWNLLNSKIDILTKKLEAITKPLNPMSLFICE